MKANAKKTSTSKKFTREMNPDLSRLAGLVKAYAPYDGSFETKIML